MDLRRGGAGNRGVVAAQGSRSNCHPGEDSNGTSEVRSPFLPKCCRRSNVLFLMSTHTSVLILLSVGDWDWIAEEVELEKGEQ